MKKSKFTTIIILIITLVLAGVAIFTAIRLYQLRTQPVAPNVPLSKPRAQEVSSCSLTFTLATAPATTPPSTTPPSTTPPATTPPSTTPPGETESPTPTGSPNSCGGTCGSNFNCGGDLVCYQGFCRNSSCATETDCTCAGTPAPTEASLPNSGTSWPTIFSAILGILVIGGSLLLAI